MFDIIVQLNCNKILGRLGSTRFHRPAHLIKTREPLSARLRQLYLTTVQASSFRRNSEDVDRFDHQISSFEASFGRLEEGKSEHTIANVKHAIKQAFDLTNDGVNLPERLKALGCQTLHLDSRDVREVGKVSNYWRISRHLAICSQRFRESFANAEWYPVPSYKTSSRSKVLPRQHVHAEIQLLVYYETTSPQLMPRIIGASKEACFLCDSFIRAHGRFSISGAHRQMFPQWTVPDLKQYTSQTVLHLRQVLSQVCTEVREEHSKSQKKRVWIPFPLQSAINLNVVRLITPSTSTLPTQTRSRDGDRPSRSNGTLNSSMSSRSEEDNHVVGHISRYEAGEADTELSHIFRERGSTDRYEPALPETPIEIAFIETVSEDIKWISISASFLTFPTIESPKSQLVQFTRGSLSLQTVSGSGCQRKISLDDLPLGEELVIKRDIHDAPHSLSFILVGPGEQKIRMRCQWHIS